MKKLILFAGAGVLLYFYTQSDKDKAPKKMFFIVEGITTPVSEDKLNSLGYYYYQTDNGEIASGYYNYTAFPSGFGIELDKKWLESGSIELQTMQDVEKLKLAQLNFKKYYNGTLPLQQV